MITGVDQGATISVDGGATWSSWYNQPTAQFYHVAVDNGYPYRIYGAQQDSGTVGITSRGNYGAITPSDWETVGGGESGYIVPDPDDPNVVYGGNTNGGLFRFVRGTGQSHEIVPRVAADFGASRRDATYRYTWTSPVAFSVTKPRAIFFGSQYVLKSTDQGQSWTRTSADLSRHGGDVTAVPSGGAMVQKLAPAEALGVVYTIAPSTLRPGLIWAGTDDGQIDVSRDDGSTWQNVTPPALSAWSKVSMLEASPHDAATAYAAIDRHRLDDDTPHIFVTHDEGKTWTEIAGGLPAGTFVRAVREDPVRKGLLFAGTEFGVYVSSDAGQRWDSLQLNLPRAPIHDLVVHDNDLIVATHGRSFWVLDDLSPLRQGDSGDEPSGTWLLKPSSTIRIRRSVNTDTPLPPETPMGQNPPDGAVIDYRLDAEPTGEVSLEILDASGALVRRFSTRDPQPPAAASTQFPESWISIAAAADRASRHEPVRLGSPLSKPAGASSGVHDCRAAGCHSGTPARAASTSGHVHGQVDGGRPRLNSVAVVKMDPRVTTSAEDLTRLFDLQRKIAQAIDDDGQALERLRASKRSGPSAATVERALVRLNEGLAELLSGVDTGDVAPTAAASQAFADFQEGARSAYRRGVKAAVDEALT